MKENFNKTIENSSSIRKRNAHLFFFKLYKAIHRLEGNTALGVRQIIYKGGETINMLGPQDF